jgi:hypothetical protein
MVVKGQIVNKPSDATARPSARDSGEKADDTATHEHLCTYDEAAWARAIDLLPRTSATWTATPRGSGSPSIP